MFSFYYRLNLGVAIAELFAEVAIVAWIFFIIISGLNGGTSNETGEITKINANSQAAEAKWYDKEGEHVIAFAMSDLGKDAKIAHEGDGVKINVSTYGAFDKLHNALNKKDSSPVVKVTGLDVNIFTKWYRKLAD